MRAAIRTTFGGATRIIRRPGVPSSARYYAGGGIAARCPYHLRSCNFLMTGYKSVMASRLTGKWVVITGASSGFGAAAARAFGVEGAKLLIGARRMDRLEAVAAEALKAGA